MTDAELAALLDRRLPHVRRIGRLPGIAAAVGRSGGVVWEGADGHADLASGVVLTPQTVHPSGSMGKVLTATAVMQLVEQGVLALGDPIVKHIDFEVRNPLGGRDVTVEDLLTHRSGLTSNGAGCTLATPEPLDQHLRAGFESGVHEYYHGVLPKWSTPVGHATRYSNTGMALLGHLVEVTNPEGLSFTDYVQAHIIEPLRMASTQFPPVQDATHVRADLWERRSTGYAGFGDVHIPTPRIHLAEYPAGNAVTTPGDLLRLVLAHLGDGEFDGVRILRPEPARDMRRNRTGGQRPHNHLDFGLMWMLHDIDASRPSAPLFGDESFLAHGGAHMYGWAGGLRAYQDQGLAIVVMTNRWSLSDTGGGSALPASASLPGWVADVASGRLRSSPADRDRPWAWKVSYLAGVILAERTVGLMGVRQRFPPAAVDAMVVGVVAGSATDRWDPDGFRAGIEDLDRADHTHAGIARFVGSDAFRLPQDELDLLFADLGGHGRPQLPMPLPTADDG